MMPTPATARLMSFLLANHRSSFIRSSMPSRLPPGTHPRAADFLTAQENFVDPTRVCDVIEWVRVEDDEIRALAGRNHSCVDLRHGRRVTGGHDDRLG